MKKILMLMFVIILLIGTVNAIKWDNGLKYEKDDLGVIIEDGHWFGVGKWFGLNKELGKLELKSHKSIKEVKKVKKGEDRAVMWYSFKNWNYYEDGLGEVVFKDMKTGKEVDKNYYFAERIVYEECFESGSVLNGSIKTTCMEKEEWERLDSKDIPSKKITIGLITDVEQGDHYDAVWEIAGKKIKKHSEWSAITSFDTSGESADPRSITNNDTFIWIIDGAGDQVYKYFASNGTYTGENWDTSTEVADSRSLTTNSTFIWVLDLTNDNVERYFMNGTYTGVTIDISVETSGDATAITNNNTFFYFVEQSTDQVDKYYLNGTFISDFSTVSGGVTPRGGTTNGTFIWVHYDSLTFGKFFENGTYTGNLTTISGASTPQGISTNTSYYWVVDNTDDEVYQFEGSLDTPIITLDTPFNTTNFTTNDILFNASISDNQNITNVSLILDDQFNETNTTAGIVSDVWTFNVVDLAEGNHTWNMESCDFDNDCVNASTTRTFQIDSLNPALNVSFPNESINIHTVNTNLFVNWSVNDTNLDACVLEFEGVNTTVTCSDNQTSINITNSINRSLTFYANDTFGNMNASSVSWVYRVFENQPIFSSTTIEGVTETFVANVTFGAGESFTLVNFSYNASGNDVTSTDLGGNMYNLSSEVTIPPLEADENITFFWIIDLASGSQVSTLARNQTAQNLGVDNCSTNTNIIFNYSMLDEEQQTNLTNTTFEIDLNLFNEDKTSSVLNFSTSMNQTNPAQICLNIDLTNQTTYAVDSVVKYSSIINYVTEYYNIQNFSLNNATAPQNINLFELLTADNTDFQVTFKDSNLVVVEDALIQLNRQYVSEGVFKTVEIPRTDSNGQTVLHMVEKDIVYNIIVTKEGVVLGTFNNVVAFCTDSVIGQCFITLNALGNNLPIFDYDSDIGIGLNFEYNETTRLLEVAFVNTDGTVKNISINGTQMDQLGNSTICSDFLVSSSGTLSCTFPDSVGNFTTIINVFVDGNLVITEYIVAGRAFDIGDAGYFLAFFLVLSLALMLMESKIGVVIGVTIGFISSILFSFLGGGVLGIGSSVVWLIISAMILAWKLNSDRET